MAGTKWKPPVRALEELLELQCAPQARSLVLLIDEIDSLPDVVCLSVLQRLRVGHRLRSRRFPQSVVLCGQDNVRDYRIPALRGSLYAARGSPFNIAAE